MHDALADGRTVRVLTIVDTYTRECLAVEAATGFRGQEVARVLRPMARSARSGAPAATLGSC